MRLADTAIETTDLTKWFPVAPITTGRFAALRSLLSPAREKRTVVDGLSIRVERGELVGLLGPNGAGKSTTIKMLTGILTPSRGEVWVNGRVPHQDRRANARRIGAVFGQKTQLWWDLSARQSLTLLRDIFDVAERDFEIRLAQFNEILDLHDFWNTPVRYLSLGQRVRCEMAAAMLHDPSVVFLDEPTIGMDVVAKQRVREFLLQQVAERDRTVLLTTHDMTEVSRLCKRVILINQGRLVFDGSLDGLRSLHGHRRTVKVTFDEPVLSLSIPNAKVLLHDGIRATLVPDGTSAPEDVVRGLIARHPVANLSVEEPNLEDVIQHVYRRAHGDAISSEGEVTAG